MPANPQYAEVDEIPDGSGDYISVGVLGDHVVLYINDGIGVFLGAEQRDRFAKAWAEAERQAEAHPQ